MTSREEQKTCRETIVLNCHGIAAMSFFKLVVEVGLMRDNKGACRVSDANWPLETTGLHGQGLGSRGLACWQP